LNLSLVSPVACGSSPSPAAVIERPHATIFVAIKNLVAGLPRDPNFGAQTRHLLALEQAGHKPEPLVHDVTLLPRHAPSCEGAKVSPMCPEYGVTYLSGRTSVSQQLAAATVSGCGLVKSQTVARDDRAKLSQENA
jgi:hypothetical protein